MPRSRRARYSLLALILYLTLCTIGGITLADATFHPARRPLTENEITAVRDQTRALDADLTDVSITTPDHATLRAWLIHPHDPNGDAVLLLHGLGDNRLGMLGYAQLLLAHGFTVLLPDARAHGLSDGPVATYGLLERNDIHQWSDFLESQIQSAPAHPTASSPSANPWALPNSSNRSTLTPTSAPSPPNLPSPIFARSPTTAWDNPSTWVRGSDEPSCAP